MWQIWIRNRTDLNQGVESVSAPVPTTPFMSSLHGDDKDEKEALSKSLTEARPSLGSSLAQRKVIYNCGRYLVIL